MNVDNGLIYIVACTGLILLAFVVGWFAYRWMRRVEDEVEIVDQPIEYPRVVSSTGNYLSATSSEEIEALVRFKIAKDPDLKDVRIDFATGPDESLEIWVNEIKYASVDEIPDERIRNAIQESVDDFNRPRS